MKTTTNDIYIKILKFANDNPGFRYQQIMDTFPKQKGIIDREIKRKQIFISSDKIDTDKYMLTFEGRIYLLEYEELNEARRSAKYAMFFAIVAILLNLFSNYNHINQFICKLIHLIPF